MADSGENKTPPPDPTSLMCLLGGPVRIPVSKIKTERSWPSFMGLGLARYPFPYLKGSKNRDSDWSIFLMTAAM
jgi:hypothetical protein